MATEKEIKDVLREAFEKFKKVLLSQRGKEPFGDNPEIVGKAFCDFRESLFLARILMKEYADENHVKYLLGIKGKGRLTWIGVIIFFTAWETNWT